MSGLKKDEPESSPADPEALTRGLELELITKRISWHKMRARRSTWRVRSLLFLFVVLVGALLAYLYFSTEMSRRGGESPSAERIERNR
jgi:chromosome condensin MukBEF MukE localization factor